MNKMKRENNTDEKKRQNSLKKNLKYAKEVSTPKKKMLTIEKMMKKKQIDEKGDEKKNVMNMVKKFENVGAKFRNKVDGRDEFESIQDIESKYDEKIRVMEYGSQTNDEKELKRTSKVKKQN